MDATDTPKTETLTRRQEKALAALLSEPTMAAAATSAGVSEMTLSRWLKKPAFVKAYRDARSEVVSHAMAQLQRATAKAVETLEDVMDNSVLQAPRVSAARTILETAVKAVELESIAARLDALEALMGGKDSARP